MSETELSTAVQSPAHDDRYKPSDSDWLSGESSQLLFRSLVPIHRYRFKMAYTQESAKVPPKLLSQSTCQSCYAARHVKMGQADPPSVISWETDECPAA